MAMNWKLTVKLLITLLLVTVILASVDLQYLIKTFLDIPAWITLTVIFGYIAGQVISNIKWRTFVNAGGIEVSFWESLKAYFIGMFINCFGLGMVGGDIIRGVLVAGRGHPRTLGLTSVVADRMHGLAVLAAIGAISAIVYQSEFLDSQLILLLVCIGSILVFAWLLGPFLVGKVFSDNSRIGKKLRDSAGMLTRDPKVLLAATVLSICFHLLQITLHWFLAIGVGAEIPFSFLLATVPFINILSSLPISWNGVGVRETGFIFFFTQLHPYLTQEQAVVMGALWLLAVTIASAVGGIVAFASKDFSFEMLRASSKSKAPSHGDDSTKRETSMRSAQVES